MRRRHFRSKKPVVRWFANELTYVDSGVAVPVSTASFAAQFAAIATHPRQSPALASNITLNERHTIETIRGQIITYGAQNVDPDESNACILHMGIKVTELDPSGAPINWNPGAPPQASDDWMWLSHSLVPALTQANVAPNVYMGAYAPDIHVHVQTKRVMKDNEALVLYMSASKTQPDLADNVIWVHPYLRCLVRFPE